jgi:hypothetical protein
MKLALLLFGISLEINKHWQYGTLYSVDYNNSYDNYQKYIFEYFTNKGYDIDVYISTNILFDKDKEELLNKYKPIKYSFIETIEEDRHLSKNKKINDVVDLCISEGKEYDMILITRFDLLFQKDFANSNIQFDKINIVSILEKPEYICDNFYLFPYKYLVPFSNIIKKNLNTSHHYIKEDLENIDKYCENPINYILNEYTVVANLSFYKIKRTSYI